LPAPPDPPQPDGTRFPDDAAALRPWHDLAQWCVLDTGFGTGAGFLAVWRAWRADARRPRMLHWVALAPCAVPADELGTPGFGTHPDELPALLADQWHGLLPGFHRLAFDDGHVLLTLCVGETQPMLRAQRFEADEIVVDASTLRAIDPASAHGAALGPSSAPMTATDLAKALARFARPGTRISADVEATAFRDALKPQGFRLRAAGDADRRAAVPVGPSMAVDPTGIGVTSRAHASSGPALASGLAGEFAPTWEVRRRSAAVAKGRDAVPGHCIVVGAGLAGAAVAASLARRGWRVTVLDAGAGPATGASGVPAGVFAPHVSSDDALLSRLTRAGLRLMRQQLRVLLREGVDWRDGGVLERRAPGDDRLPAGWNADGPNESWRATPDRLAAHGLPADATALWHARAGWVRPARLIEAWLAQPGIALRTRARVERIERVADGLDAESDDGTGTGAERRTLADADAFAGGAGGTPDDSRVEARWVVLDADGRRLAEGDRVVVAAGFESAVLTGTRMPLQRVRGQLAWGRMDLAAGLADTLPMAPLNGDGHLIAHVPDAAGAFWLTGATFDRDRGDVGTSTSDTEANLARLARLHPAAHALLTGVATSAEAREAAIRGDDGDEPPRSDGIRAWAGVRCASADRRPLVGPLDPELPEGPWLCTAMGSRGLSFAVLCAELLAARWHGEPLPLPVALAQALDTARTARAPRKASASTPQASGTA
jgi:tRNA 5-methylaminomethyl-2-thiouridine biosynthesis bifunctional protein